MSLFCFLFSSFNQIELVENFEMKIESKNNRYSSFVDVKHLSTNLLCWYQSFLLQLFHRPRLHSPLMSHEKPLSSDQTRTVRPKTNRRKTKRARNLNKSFRSKTNFIKWFFVSLSALIDVFIFVEFVESMKTFSTRYGSTIRTVLLIRMSLFAQRTAWFILNRNKSNNDRDKKKDFYLFYTFVVNLEINFDQFLTLSNWSTILHVSSPVHFRFVVFSTEFKFTMKNIFDKIFSFYFVQIDRKQQLNRFIRRFFVDRPFTTMIQIHHRDRC